MSLPTFKIIIPAVGLAVLLLVTGSSSRANDQNAGGVQNAYQTPIVLPSRLQVSGTADKISIDAEHSDVQSALKSVLKQAGKQYEPDASVSGQVTLLLTDQTLESVLKAICSQSYLRYTLTQDGVYKFSRDDDAVKRAFSQLNTLNALLRQHLRLLGLEVPSDGEIDSARRKETGSGAAGTFGFGAQNKPDSSKRDEAQASEDKIKGGTRRSGAPNESIVPLGASRALNDGTNLKKDAQGNIANIHTDFINQGDLNQFLGNGASVPNAQQYAAFLRQNNFVYFNIPEEKPSAVASILQQFSQQSNVPILLDHSIPNSLKFRVWGTLSPRQLPEALNVLAPTAHLQWRWIGGTIFVFPSPDFQVYFGDSSVPSSSTRDRRSNK